MASSSSSSNQPLREVTNAMHPAASSSSSSTAAASSSSSSAKPAPAPKEEVSAVPKTLEEVRALIVAGEDMNAAVAAASIATEAAVKQYGETGIEVAPYYQLYGQALLRAAEKNSNLFGQEVNAAAQANREAQGIAEAAPADPSEDLGLAFEVLEVARTAYEKAGNELEAMKTLRAIADVCMEMDNFDQAYADYGRVLDMCKRLLPAHDTGNLCSAHCDLAVAAKYKEDYATARGHFRDAAEVYAGNMRRLTPDAVKAELVGDLSDTEKLKKELAEFFEAHKEHEARADCEKFASYHSDIMQQIEELEDDPTPETAPDIAQIMQQAFQATSQVGFGASSGSDSAEPAPVMQLVAKRKGGDDKPDEGSPPKKQKHTDGEDEKEGDE